MMVIKNQSKELLMNNIKVLKKDKNSKVLVITPLLSGHKISKKTKITIKRNKTPITWISSESNQNIPINVQFGINWYMENFKEKISYYIPIDRDIILGRYMIDKLYKKLKNSPSHIGYAYANFKFKGYINQKFPAVPFNINKLVESNYISSNSLFKLNVVKKVGLVKDNNLVRFLDWAFLLKCYKNNFYGINCPEASFIACSSPNDISSSDGHDYLRKNKIIFEKYIKPLLNNNLNG